MKWQPAKAVTSDQSIMSNIATDTWTERWKWAIGRLKWRLIRTPCYIYEIILVLRGVTASYGIYEIILGVNQKLVIGFPMLGVGLPPCEGVVLHMNFSNQNFVDLCQVWLCLK